MKKIMGWQEALDKGLVGCAKCSHYNKLDETKGNCHMALNVYNEKDRIDEVRAISFCEMYDGKWPGKGS